MRPYFSEDGIEIHCGDALETLREMPDASVQCCVTSPPYWGLRDYGVVGQLGLEANYLDYVAKITAVFAEVRRVLKDDGTLWLNLGDSYATGAGKVGECPGGGAQGERWKGEVSCLCGHSEVNHDRQYGCSEDGCDCEAFRPRGYRGTRDGSRKHSNGAIGQMTQANRMPQPGLKPKDLVGIPWRVAFALQADGWYLRSDVIWAKPNPMPESVTDRPTKSHEYLFLLAKSERYYYDADAIKEASITCDPRRPYTSLGAWDLDGRPVDQRHGGKPRTSGNKTNKYVTEYEGSDSEEHRTKAGLLKVASVPWETRNRRSVWTIATEPYPEAHFATFPPDLVIPCVKAGCPPDGVVLDPFMGSGTTLAVARQLGRRGVGIELNPVYCVLAEKRFSQSVLNLQA